MLIIPDINIKNIIEKNLQRLFLVKYAQCSEYTIFFHVCKKEKLSGSIQYLIYQKVKRKKKLL